MTAEPSILIRKLRPQDLFLIFASDGLWEQLSDEKAVDIVLKSPRVVRPHFIICLCTLYIYNFFYCWHANWINSSQIKHCSKMILLGMTRNE